jgi:hypothetical protein
MNALQRTVLVYRKANAVAWRTLKAVLPRDLDPWVLAGVAVLGATLTLVLSGHSGAALIVGASSLWLLVLQRVIDG